MFHGQWLKSEGDSNSKKSDKQLMLITKSDYKRQSHFTVLIC